MSERFAIPGSDAVLDEAYDAHGALVRLAVGERVHVRRTADGAWLLGDGLAHVRELGVARGLLRRVRAGAAAWTERYAWDEHGRPVEVDGVRVERDAAGRVVACRGPDGDWTYAYGAGGLERVRSPRGERRIARGAHGRPVRLREAGAGARATALAYDADGVRRDVPGDPPGWHRDVLGRLWTVHDAAGAIVATYLWSGLSCLGRIDGPPDAPLDAAFLLDPTGTPVRVVERGGRVVRIPRDAFGEALLEHAGVPGLFGGPVHGGLVRLPMRALDPRAGAFDRPDPLDGRARDPRRGAGFAGLLPVDRARTRDAAAPYAVCRDDPISRSDPSGGISAAVVPMVLSSLTWSSQYHIVNVHFLQLFVNLLPSLFTTDEDGRWAMRRFFSIEGMASQRGGGFGLRFDPVGIGAWIKLFAGAPRRFTLHQVFWCPADDEGWDGLRIIRMFAPAADFRPSCYGTVLRGEPARAGRFVLRGAANEPPAAATPHFPAPAGEPWVRHGGTAEPVFPGSRVPRFPRGGLHFTRRAPDEPGADAPDVKRGRDAIGPQDGRIVELAPAGAIAQGTAVAQARLKLPGTGHRLAAGAHLLLRHGADRELHDVVTAVERDGATSVRLARDVALGATTGIAVRGATVAAAGEALPRGAQADRLDARAPASTVRYARGDVLRLTAGGDPVAAEVARLEVAVTLDAAAPAAADLRLPWEVFAAAPVGGTRPVTRAAAGDALEFPEGQDAPAAGDALLVSGGGTSAAFTVATAEGRLPRLDRALPAGLTDPLTWRALQQGRRLGRADAAPAAPPGTALRLTPELSGQAPAAGTVLLLRAGSDAVARTVASADADDLVLAAPLAGVAAGAALTVAKVALAAPDVARATLEDAQALTLAPAAARDGRTLRLHQLTTAAVAAGPVTLVQAGARAGDGVGFALPAGGGELPQGEAGTDGPTPGQLVLLAPDAGAGPLPAVVGQVRVTVTLDRRLAFPAAVAAAATVPPPAVLQGGLELVPLAAAGPVHAADQLGPRAVLIRPEVRIGTRLERVEFARPQVGDLVEVSWTGAPAPRLHRVVHVDGAAATLDAEGGALPVNTPGLTVQRLDATDPRNGTTRSARAGDLLALRADQSDLRADVWQPSALQAGDRVAVTDGTRAFPARVVARTRLDVAWLPGPALDAAATTVTITAPALAGAPVLVPAAAQEGADVVLDATTGTLAAGPNLVLAVEYGDERAAAAGTFDAGSVLVPDEPAVELSRHQALVDHEMAHTVQSAIWGPILLSPFPFRGLEEIVEAAGHPYPPALHHIGKLYSLGGLMNFLTSTIVSGVAWVVFKLVAFFVRLFSGQPLSPGWLGHADWLPFHAATIPDAANPRRIRLAAAGRPALSAGDLVEVTAGESYSRATVEVVDGTAVELDSPAPSGEGLQIALVAEGDETSLVEHAVARHTGFGALEVPFDVYFDPWSQISNRGDLAPGSFEDVLFRAARDLFGSSSWTLFPFGYFFWDNALRNRSGEGHLSKMEQSASEQSGENYSAIGRLDGRLEVVGDVARYWHFVEWRHDTALLGAGGDSPGPHGQDLLRVMPSAREDPGVVSEPPNEQVDAAPDAERPGAQVADVFTARDPGDPLAANVPAGATPRGFRPGARGAVPVGPRVERCVGAYVAFTRPPAAGPPATTHRISSVNRFSGADRSLQAQQAGKQTILFDRAVADVQVAAEWLDVAEGARVQLLRGQRARLRVTPDGDRRYAVAVLQPATGTVLRAGGDLVLVALGANGIEPVEVTRRYAFDAATGHFDHAALDAHGLHLPADVHVPVRRFEVEVVDTIPPRAAPDPRTAPLAGPAHPGDDVYVVIPSTVARPLRRDAVDYPGGRPSPVTDPLPTITPHVPSDEVALLLRWGSILRVRFGVGDPPEAPALVELSASVRLLDGEAEVFCLVALDPHFTLDAPSFSVARGARLSLTCSGTVAPGTVTVAPAAGIAASTAGQVVHLDVAAAAALGSHTVVVQDAADASHRARRTFTVTA